jgi:glycyl-tRNA synthetase beta chain
MQEKEIRLDIIEAGLNSFNIDNITKIYNKSDVLNNYINKEIGTDIILSYKRASNILQQELRNRELEISNTTDPGLFKSEYEKNLYKKIHELKKYFDSINNDENYKLTLENLAESKKVIFDFFDNVKVNDDDKKIQKNRLELLQMLCKTFDNYITFSSINNLQ